MKFAYVSFALALLASCSTPDTEKRLHEETDFVIMSSAQEPTDHYLIAKFQNADNIRIEFGPGGELNGMIKTLEYLDAHPEKLVVIDGPCFSACTLLLSRPNNVVYTERAEFYFHSARKIWSVKGHKVREEISWSGNKKMIQNLPDPIVEWIHQTDAFYSVEFTHMDNSTVRSLVPEMFVPSAKLPKSAYRL